MAAEPVHPSTTLSLARKWSITLSVMLITVMQILDTSITNVALPHMQGSLSTSVEETSWVITSYLAANAIVIPATAWDVALGRAAPLRKVTPEELRQRASYGLLKPLLYRGRYVSTVRKADNSALLRQIAQIDRACRKLDLSDPTLWRFTPRSGSTAMLFA